MALLLCKHGHNKKTFGHFWLLAFALASNWPVVAQMTLHGKVEDFIAELQHLDKLVQAQPGGQLAQSMTTSLCTKLQASKDWTSSAILSLIQALEESTLPKEKKDTIQGAINSLGGQNQGHLKTVLQGQVITFFCPYISKLDWQKLAAAPSNTTDTMSILAARLKAMGLVSLKESTKKQAMAVILYLLVHKGNKPQPSAVTRRNMMAEFSAIFAHTPGSKAACLTKYPDKPQDLGPEWMLQAYGQDEPAMVTISSAWLSFAPKQHVVFSK